jgi:ribosomal protein S3
MAMLQMQRSERWYNREYITDCTVDAVVAIGVVVAVTVVGGVGVVVRVRQPGLRSSLRSQSQGPHVSFVYITKKFDIVLHDTARRTKQLFSLPYCSL